MRRLLMAAAVVGLASGLAWGQAGAVATPAQQAAGADAQAHGFEVSAVRVNKSGGMNAGSRMQDGTFTGTNVPLKNVMEYSAYGIPGQRILGGPAWLGSVRFDIEAKEDALTLAEMKGLGRDERQARQQKMFQELLADRFKLLVHWETREMPVYELVAAKGGSKLTASKEPAGSTGINSGSASMSIKGISMEGCAQALTRVLAEELGRVVVDKTGIEGRFDMELKWTPEDGASGGPNGNGEAQDAQGPSIFTALQEQLGLKLESAKRPVQALVIDHVEMPSEN